jgi:hypothetical protein
LAGLASSLALSSCKKEFLDTKPTTQIDASSVLSTVENARAALNGIHRSMFIRYNNQGEFGFGSVMINNEALGEDYVFSGQSNGWWVSFYRWIDHRNANSGNAEFPYRFFYRIISNANVLINGVDGIPNAIPTDRDNVKGQALAYRAWAYHNLVQLYGIRFDKTTPNSNPGVPLVLTNTTVPQARATVAEVYQQINKDLDEAEKLLTTSRADKSNFNVNVVRGLQARVALTQQDWERAATKAAAARQGLSLMSNAQQLDGYSNWDNPEWMWGSRQIDDQTEFFTAYLAYISYNFNSTNIRTNPKCINSLLYNTMNANDVRRALWRPTPTSTNVVTPPGGIRFAFMNQKFKAKDFANSTGDIPYMRVAEMFLMEAEARARNGQEEQAKDVFTTFMQNRVPGYTRSTNTGAAFIDEIMLSRRVELWGEGFRFLDLKRLNLPLNRNGANHNQALAVMMTVAAGSNDWQYVIPQTELNANKLVVQNP